MYKADKGAKVYGTIIYDNHGETYHTKIVEGKDETKLKAATSS